MDLLLAAKATERSSTPLCIDKVVEVDHGCAGDDKMKTPSIRFSGEERRMKSNARAQHKAVNGRLKQFGVLAAHF